MTKPDDAAIAHMSMIQGVVTRLETNSFTLKALAMTLATAVLAFSGSVKHPNWIYPVAGCLPVVVFWIMDATYLRLGRLFRRLYDAARHGKIEEPFSMNIEGYISDEQSALRIAFSWSICWFYLSILLAFGIASFLLLKQGV